jgi:hydroxylysine kinase
MVEAAVLSSEVPAFSVEEALDLVRRHWALEPAAVSRLASERDQNFRVEAGSGRFVLKIANRAEPPGVTRLQTAALRHVAASDPTVPVPRVLPTRSGDHEAIAAGSTIRLLTWMDGLPWHLTPASRAQRQSVAAGHARLVLALADFVSDTPSADLQWDVQHAGRLRGQLGVVPPELRAGVAAALDCFEARAAPLLARLPRQFVHNDIQPHNVVVDQNDTDRMTGILDFGDLVQTPVACDLGVAAAYHVLPGGHPLQTAAEYIAAFHAVRPLSSDEFEALPALILARQATTIVITSRRALTHAANAAYILRNQPTTRAGLAQLLPLGYDAVVDYFRRACR